VSPAGPTDGPRATVRHRPERSRYELLLDGEVIGFADYHLDGEVVVLPHTVVDPAHRGRGLAELLVGEVLDELRAQGRRVRPDCWYVARHLRLHPEHADLAADR
jgi:predicted GNAT family acetyltransferase